MAKPRIQSRVDSHVKSAVVDFAEDRDMTEAEAVRYLVQNGLDAETTVAADGGEVVSRLDELERRESRETALLGFTIVFGVGIWSGYFSGLLALTGGFVLGLSLVVMAVSPILPSWGRWGVSNE